MADAKNSRLHPWHLFFGILASIATVVSCYVGYLTYLRQLQTNPGNPSAAQIAISTQPATTQALGTELYRQNRDRLIEILKKGQFYGLLTQPDGTQSAVDLRTNWDDTAGTASGDIHFADPDLRVNVGGQIEPQDPANGDQVTLSLASTNKDDGVFLAISAG